MSQAKKEVYRQNLGTTLEGHMKNKWYGKRDNNGWKLSKKSVGSEAPQKFLEKALLVIETTLQKLGDCRCLGSGSVHGVNK